MAKQALGFVVKFKAVVPINEGRDEAQKAQDAAYAIMDTAYEQLPPGAIIVEALVEHRQVAVPDDAEVIGQKSDD